MTRFQLGEKENQLLHSIYAAAIAPEKWLSVIETIVTHIGADEGQLVFIDPESPERNFIKASRRDACMQYSPISDSTLNGIKLLCNGAMEGTVILSSQALIGIDPSVSTKVNLSRACPEMGAVIPLITQGGVTSALGFYTGSGEARLSDEACQFLQQLAPHISRSLHIYNQVSAAKRSQRSLVESLKCSHLGVLLLDAHLRVVFATAEAKRLLEKNPGIQINRYGQLETRDSKQQSQLSAALQTLLCHKANNPATEFSMPIRTPEKVHPLKLTAVILEGQEVRTSKVHIAVFMTDPDAHRQIHVDYLQQAFGLTRTESAIAQLLLSGYSIGEVAAKRQTSLETARWQLKSILHKTNTANQAELTRLLMILSRDVERGPLTIDQSLAHTTHMGDD